MIKPWFKRKLYGWGWYPSTWQGWVIIVIYVVAMIKAFLWADMNSHSNSDTLIAFAFHFIVLSLILIAICYLKGEKPKWQWGEKKED